MSTPALSDPVRLRVLAETGLMDSAPEEDFDRLVRIAQRLLNTPIVLVSLLDERKQFFKSALGLSGEVAEQRQTPLSHSFCQHVVRTGGPLVIPDAEQHPLVRDNPAIRDLGVRSYLGFPICTEEGLVMGSFCAIDHLPRPWSVDQQETLRDLATIVSTQVNLRIARYRQAEIDRRLNKISTQVPGVIYQYLLRPDGTSAFPYASEGIRDIYRCTPEEVRTDASKVFAVLHPDDVEGIKASIDASARDLRPWGHEYRVRFPDGTQQWLRGEATPERLEDGSVLWHGFISNISARKDQEMRLAAALAEVQQRQDAFDQHAIVGITDAAGRIIYANPKFCTISKYAEGELIGKTHAILKSGVHDAAFYREMWRTITAGGTWHGELCNRDKQGGLYWVSSTIVPLLGQDGRPARYIAVRTDITQQKHTEAALRRAKALESAVLGSTDYMMVATDVAGTVVSVNEATAKALGYAPDELIGRATPALWHDRVEVQMRAEALSRELGHAVLPGFDAFIAKAQVLGGADENEWTFVRKDGRRIPVTLTVTCLRDDTGRLFGFLGLAKDIIEARRAAEEKLALERKLAETAKLESLGVLAGGIAHDFNNILTGVIGHTSLMRLELPPSSPHQEALQQIEAASRRAADLCRQMLAYSGKGRFLVRPLDLNGIIRETSRLIEISINKRTITRFQLVASLPAIMADETQLRQVVMNLVINASEAIGERGGAVTIATGVCRLDAVSSAAMQVGAGIPSGDYVWLEVSDTGEGMTPEVQAKIFDPFFTTKFIGRGLGLAAVQGIVRGHHGAIRVSSEPGKGTTFRLLFPCAPPLEAEPASPVALPAERRGRGTVLVIDDEEPVRTVVARTLEFAGFTVEVAADGSEGLRLFGLNPTRYALVLLDLTMPNIDGEETFRQLRQIRPGVRVLLMSGFSQRDVIARFAGKGLAGFIPKPIETKDLIRKAIELTEAGGSA